MKVGDIRVQVRTRARRKPPAEASAPAPRRPGRTATRALAPLKAYPSIVYPAVKGTPEEQRLVYETLDRLPLRHVGQTHSITWVDEIPSKPGFVTFGDARHAPGHAIRLSRDGLSREWTQVGGSKTLVRLDRVNPEFARYTVRHELAHAIDFPDSLQEQVLRGPISARAPFGKAPHVSGYAATNPYEDFAETYAFHKSTREEILAHRADVNETNVGAVAPEKARVMERLDRQTPFEKLADTPAARSTGKYLGQVLEAVPGARVALQAVGTTFSALTVADGVRGVVGASRSRSVVDGLHGALAVGGGLAFLATFASGYAAPVGLALLGAREGLDQAEKRGLVVRAPSRSRVPWWQFQWKDDKPPARVKDRAGVAAAAVGGGLGGALGGFAGPLLGMSAGFAVGGPIGGVVGMIAGGFAGYKGGAILGARAGMKVAEALQA